jgi:methylated-DNA-[protein]-cysteine S-methyltransferase
MKTLDIFVEYLNSDFGKLEICANSGGITAIRFVDNQQVKTVSNQHTQQAVEQLTAYFNGQRSEFDLTLNPQGTDFQQLVWQQLIAIPYGQTCSYAHIAKQINNPKAVRAVGAANGRNPITIVVPCHRVIGSNGKLTGYAWGTDIKAGLLNLEKAALEKTNPTL